MAINLKWFEHTEPQVANALANAKQYVQTNPPVYRAIQATEDTALNVQTARQTATYQVLIGHWMVINDTGEISVYTDIDFKNLYELKV